MLNVPVTVTLTVLLFPSEDSHQYTPLSIEASMGLTRHPVLFNFPQRAPPWPPHSEVMFLLVVLFTLQSDCLSSQLRKTDSSVKNWDLSGLKLREAVGQRGRM